MSTMVGTRLSDELIHDIQYVAEEEKSDKSKVIRELLFAAVKQKLKELALEKYAKQEVSLGKAAELAQLPLADFMYIAAERKVPLHYSLASLEKDFKAALR
ncbi:MAG: UPF0175 family protein [Nanoarchaeota archaeon]|nr:UPF0175 family protein [Nanoarchaeota archaeon]